MKTVTVGHASPVFFALPHEICANLAKPTLQFRLNRFNPTSFGTKGYWKYETTLPMLPFGEKRNPFGPAEA